MLSFALLGPASAATLVAATTDELYEALELAANGDRIELTGQEYVGRFVLSGGVSLIGAGRGQTTLLATADVRDGAVLIIQGDATVEQLTIDGAHEIPGVRVDTGDVTLRDIEIRNAAIDGGLRVLGGHVALLDSHIHDNETDNDGGGVRHDGDSLLVDGCLICGNRTFREGSGGGGLIAFSPNLTVQRSVFFDNEAEFFAGGAATFAGGLIQHNTFIDNRALYIIGFEAVYTPATFRNNLVVDHVSDVAVDAWQTTIEGGYNLFFNNNSPGSTESLPGTLIDADPLLPPDRDCGVFSLAMGSPSLESPARGAADPMAQLFPDIGPAPLVDDPAVDTGTDVRPTDTGETDTPGPGDTGTPPDDTARPEPTDPEPTDPEPTDVVDTAAPARDEGGLPAGLGPACGCQATRGAFGLAAPLALLWTRRRRSGTPRPHRAR